MLAVPDTTKILFIEDDQADFRSAEVAVNNIKSKASYTIECAPDVDVGLASILENRHDIYFVDYNLNGSDGLALVKAAFEKGHEGPFILLTGMDQGLLINEAMKSGFYGYLLKSEITPFLLERTIAYTLQRKRIEQALKHEKEFSSFIISEIPYLVVSVDRDGLIATANPYVQSLTGRSEADLVGSSWKELICDEALRDNIVYRVGERDEILFDAPMHDSEGRERQIVWNVMNKQMSALSQKNVSFVLSGKDMTEQFDMEVLERERQKTEALGYLAGGVAHEINNLLQPVLFCADVVKGKVDDAKSIEALDKIIRNTITAGKIVDDILTYARKDTSENVELPVVQTVLDMSDFITDMIPDEITLDFSGVDSSDVGCSFVNGNNVYRIMQNAISNAAHAMNNSGTVFVKSSRVTFEQFEPRLDLVAGSYLQIHVQDHGVGIAPEILNKVTDPFFTTKETGEGTGLGLSIVSNIMKNWRGALEVQSELGKGTCVTFYFPVSSS